MNTHHPIQGTTNQPPENVEGSQSPTHSIRMRTIFSPCRQIILRPVILILMAKLGMILQNLGYRNSHPGYPESEKLSPGRSLSEIDLPSRMIRSPTAGRSSVVFMRYSIRLQRVFQVFINLFISLHCLKPSRDADIIRWQSRR